MKSQFHLRHLIALMIAILSAGASYGQGSVRAMYFPGSGILTPTPVATTNSYVDLGTDLKDSLATTSFTIELWVKMGTTNLVNPVIIGDKDWTSGSNTGFVLSYYASTDGSSGSGVANSLRFNFKPAGTGVRVDYDIMLPLAMATKWNHVAITVNRTGSIIAYLNGIQTGQAYVASTANISADAGKTIAGTLPIRLGTDGKPFGYRAPFNGQMDEVRIWKTVRTAQQIRDNMCHKLAGTESGLLGYYRMDETTGATVTNGATATAGLFNGTIVNGTSRVASGAPVGDTSVTLYTSSWAGQSLQLATGNRGVFTIDSVTAPGSYLHLYQVNAVPDSISGLTSFSNNNVYFGTFASGDTFRYYPKYNYSNYANAVTFNNTIGFFTRKFNADAPWSVKTNLYNNTAASLIRTDSVYGTRQFFLANFTSTCNTPTAPAVNGTTVNSAILNWTSGGAALWNIQYGVSGFTLGSGTKVPAINAHPYTLTGLLANTTYQYYVQDTCTGIGASSWAGPFSFTTLPNFGSAGSGYAMHFNGSGVQYSTVQTVNMGGTTRDTLATSNFTIEMWVKMGATNTGNPPLIADKDYVSGANTGICWTYTASPLFGDAPAHVFRFNFKPTGGTRRDYDMLATDEHTWNHLAITVDRKGFIKGYVNGVYKASSYASGAGSVAADSGKTLAGTMPLFLGTDGTGNYRVPLNADMDEVRIWNSVRTETEIRDAMCHKLTGNEPGLVTYYRMDEATGNSVQNSAVATTGLMNGTTVNSPMHVVSSAPIGDTSVYIYPASGWNGVALSMNTTDRGTITVDSLAATNVPGMHIYMVNGVPNFQAGISDIGTTNKYAGVFTAGNTATTYRVQYDYNNYTNAVTNNANLHLYNRSDNASTYWAQLPATHNTTAHVFSKNQPLGVRQYLLSDFVAGNCAPPTAIVLNSVDTTNASFSWLSTAGTHHTKYGLAGFDFGPAASNSVNGNTQVVSGLISSTAYEFYIQDSCGAANTSSWVGPYYFETTNPCPKPTNVYADSITTSSMVVKWTDNGVATLNYNVSWGISGSFTDPNIGILQNTTSPRLALTGLQINTSYDFYINTNCNANVPKSGWVGPFTYKTDSVSTSIPSLTEADKFITIYPNPAKDNLSVDLLNNNAAAISKLSIYNNLGVCIYTQAVLQSNHLDVHTASFPAGVYYVELRSANTSLHKTIIIQH